MGELERGALMAIAVMDRETVSLVAVVLVQL